MIQPTVSRLRLQENVSPRPARSISNRGSGKFGIGNDAHDGSPLAREELAERIYQGWKAAWEQTRKHELTQVMCGRSR